MNFRSLFGVLLFLLVLSFGGGEEGYRCFFDRVCYTALIDFEDLFFFPVFFFFLGSGYSRTHMSYEHERDKRTNECDGFLPPPLYRGRGNSSLLYSILILIPTSCV